jgi:hypothetical protein
MPYIKKIDRKKFESLMITLQHSYPTSVGELNYLVSCLVKMYIDVHGGNYQAFNDAIGAMECSKMEMYRRFAIPYEDLKCKENGDII